jgi:hypothetical protein
MADTSTKIVGPVRIHSDSKERVAFELMERVANFDETKPKDKKYWLALYREALHAVEDLAP